ncbi:hypothetical protein HAPAU_39860 [Halalkalicoccus paucihalophilus]|uniref:Uncharacterized protein n=1 Tax=Halalkalicoccus paucihalophilus TaxID=1008153 RepID=A0A151A951_9EURY|nr:hypothetical protein HAPAU_39860 [Halalkalicoccus paucihalophilus]
MNLSALTATVRSKHKVGRKPLQKYLLRLTTNCTNPPMTFEIDYKD